MKKNIQYFAILVLFLGFSNFVTSKIKYWQGTTSALWNKAENWDNAQLPQNNDTVWIDPSYYQGTKNHPQISTSSSFFPGNLYIKNGGILTLSANLSIKNDLIISSVIDTLRSKLELTSGTISISHNFILDTLSLCNIHEGTLTIEQDLFVKSGSIFSLDNNASVQVNGKVKICSSNLAPSKIQAFAGTINIRNDLIMDGAIPASSSQLGLYGGALNIEKDLVFTGKSSAYQKIVLEGGTGIVWGNFQNTDPQAPLNLSLKSGALYIKNNLLSATSQDSIIQSGGILIFDGNTAEFLIDGIFEASDGTILFDGNTKVKATKQNPVFHTLAINSGKTLYLDANSFPLEIRGDWYNDMGNFLPNSQKIVFSGEVPQNIINTGNLESFYDLELKNKSAAEPAFSFFQDTEVTHHLTMTSGSAFLNEYTFTLGTFGGMNTALTYYSGSFLQGWFKRFLSINHGLKKNNLVFPMGRMSSPLATNPFFLSLTENPVTMGSVQIYFKDSAGLSNVNFMDDQKIDRRQNAYWTVIAEDFSGGQFEIQAGGSDFEHFDEVSKIRLTLADSAIGLAGESTGTIDYFLVSRLNLDLKNLNNNFYLSEIDSTSLSNMKDFVHSQDKNTATLLVNPVLKGNPISISTNGIIKWDEVKIIDLLGHVHSQSSIPAQESPSTILVENHLNAGFYLVSLQKEKNSICLKLIVE